MCWLHAAACRKGLLFESRWCCPARAASLHAAFDSPWRGSDVLRRRSGAAAAPASPFAHSERPLLCLCHSSVAILKDFAVDLNLISIFSSATCRWLTFCCGLLLTERLSGSSSSFFHSGWNFKGSECEDWTNMHCGIHPRASTDTQWTSINNSQPKNLFESHTLSQNCSCTYKTCFSVLTSCTYFNRRFGLNKKG